MNSLEYAEATVGETLDRAHAAYDSVLEAVFKFATLVAGGAGGAGVYFLGKVGTDTIKFAPVAALSVWWFVIAGAVFLRGAKSNALMLGPTSAAIRARIAKHTKPADGDDVASTALWLTRWDHLAALDEQIEVYSNAVTRRSRVLDCAYWCVAASPLVAGLAYLLTTGRP